MKYRSAFLGALGAILGASYGLSQVCYPDTVVPVPVVIQITAHDELTGEPLYTREGFLFLGPIHKLLPNVEEGLVCSQTVTLYRIMRPNGERCNPVSDRVIEVGKSKILGCIESFCYPEGQGK